MNGAALLERATRDGLESCGEGVGIRCDIVLIYKRERERRSKSARSVSSYALAALGILARCGRE
jgi:hypothetical protein